MKKKTFWCVMSEFYNDGTVKAAMISRDCEKKPDDTYRICIPSMEAFHDWFNSPEEAGAALAEARAKGKKQEGAA